MHWGLNLGLGAPAAHAEGYPYRMNSDEFRYCTLALQLHDCYVNADAVAWARGAAEWLYPGPGLEDGIGDAFRHCIWAGALSQRLGHDRAYTLVLIHENIPGNPLRKQAMDVYNDQKGLDIGHEANEAGVDDTWGYVIDRCRSMADARQLNGPYGELGNY